MPSVSKISGFNAGYIKIFCLMASSVLILASCDLAANYNKADRASNTETQDFRDALAERTPDIDEGGSKSASSFPDLQPYISTQSTAIKPMPLVSVSVNQSVPLRDTLFELAEQAGYDVELDPRITGSIIFTARNKPFDEVMNRICDMAGLRINIVDNTVRVELDEAYNKIYKVDYLSLIRTNSGSISTNVSVVSGGGTDTGSNYSVNSESSTDFWAEVDLNLRQLLGGITTGAMRTKTDPRISAVEKNPPPAEEDDDADSSDNDNSSNNNDDDEKAPEAVLTVDSLPVDGGAAADGAPPAMPEGGATFSINKQAGILNVYATDKGHKQVEAYLKELRRSITSQVLIEAKIFEVALNDEYITGIDWSLLGMAGGEAVTGFSSAAARTFLNTLRATGADAGVSPPAGSAVVDSSNLTIGYAGNDAQALVTAISGFGTVRALASPRLTVLNNQSGVLNVATNNVYFELDIDSSVDDDTGVRTTEIDSSIKSVPEGVLVNVQPSVNLENRTISLSVRPTVSRITAFKSDPSVAFVVASVPEAAGIVSNIPELNVQEIDTVVQVRSGQAIVMGGLLQDRAVGSREGVPVLGELPVVGGAFRKHTDLVRKTELVIFLKATLLDSPDESIVETDKDLYRKFSGDRRPFKL